ncbi:enoyl-CoA hydratase-related protein [Maritimibacter sp. UBA3975]|uniref:enoyl-CoA hydratase/isomerase family protein n=1 Tax=Maritimibacter sp. UBA3975 TaxID=1946833 RepID=UPI000C096FB7|nr:enoyl-CoA hydratase-related protein [Maritimibacter sp. UBA3975]MAM61550.1 enoyl-CoA hydratase [Maritimibacter sp.]|tara:strand:+ start:18496 stop:19305 length:810 start_codon:yes stop_codon:yes gene_type:complete
MNTPFLFERDGHVATLTFNRPERRNAMSPEVICRLADAMADIAEDGSIRAVILTGAGDKAFCSGGDLELSLPLLSGARAPETEWDHRFLDDPSVHARTALRGFEMNKPIVAAINGPCMAGGMEILLATDIRLAVPFATFALPEAARGVIPFAGALARLPRQIPYTAAMEMMVANVPMDAETALRHGLINRIVPPEDLQAAARGMAERIAANAPVSVRQIKKTVVESIGRPLEEGFVLEDRAKAIVMETDDAREGPRAFMEKRAPDYKGS